MTELMAQERFEQAESHALPIGAGERKVLTFTIGRESFALVIDGIKEIIEYSGVTRVPMTPAHLRGVINLRGSVVPVVDLAIWLGRPGSSVGRRTCIVVVEVEHGDEITDIGLVVDAVTEVLDIDAADITPAPSFGTTIASEFIAGMGRVKGRFVVILHPQRVLDIQALGRF